MLGGPTYTRSLMIKFIRNYRGKATNEQFFEAGTEAEFDKETEAYLVEVEAAEQVKVAKKKESA